jgi:hypothetical protein
LYGCFCWCLPQQLAILTEKHQAQPFIKLPLELNSIPENDELFINLGVVLLP